MREFIQKEKVFKKSNNSIKKISLNYTYSLVMIIIATFILDFIFGYPKEALLLIKNFFVITIILFLSTCIMNIIIKKYPHKTIYTDNNILSLSIIITLFSKDNPQYIIIISTILTAIIKHLSKKRNLSSSLYGIFILIAYDYGFTAHTYMNIDNLTILDFLINPNYVSPVLSIIATIYLFYKKSLKYHIVFSYIVTTILAFLLYSILKRINLEYVLSVLTLNSLIFLSIYALSDYKTSPTIGEVGVLYGIIVSTITITFSFIIPCLSAIIPMLIAPFILTEPLEKISPKLKYNHKKYHRYIVVYSLTTIILLVIVSRII